MGRLGVFISQPLFHSTGFSKFQKISESGLKAKAGGPYNDAYHDNAVCFTRNVDFLYNNIDFFGAAQVVIVLDGVELGNKFKKYPFDYYPGSKALIRGDQKTDDYEFEERISIAPPVRDSGKDLEEFCLRETTISPKYFKCLLVKESFWDKNTAFFINLGIPVIIVDGKNFRIPEKGVDYDSHLHYDADIDWHQERISKLFRLKDLTPEQLEVAKKFSLKYPEESFSLITRYPVNVELVNFVCGEFLQKLPYPSDNLSTQYLTGLNNLLSFDMLAPDNLEAIFYKIALPRIQEDPGKDGLVRGILQQKNCPPNLLFKLEDSTSLSSEELIQLVSSAVDYSYRKGKGGSLVNYVLDYLEDLDDQELISMGIEGIADSLDFNTFNKALKLIDSKKEILGRGLFSELTQEQYIKYIYKNLSKIIELVIYFKSEVPTSLEKIIEKANVRRSDLIKMYKYVDDKYSTRYRLNGIIKNRLQKKPAKPLN